MRVLLALMLTTLVMTPASAQLARPEAIAAAARRAMREMGAQGLAIATIDRGRVVSAQVFGARNARGDPLTPQTVMYGASLTKAALGVIAFDGPQGPGWFKGGHDDITANTMVCLERTRRCVVVLANDVRAERAFPSLVRSILGETGAPYRWEYPDIPRP